MASKNVLKYYIKGQADLDVSSLKTSVQQARNLLSKLRLPDNLGESFENQISEILKGVEKLSSKITRGFYSEKEVENAIKDYDALARAVVEYNKELKKIAPDAKGIELKSGENVRELKKVNTALKHATKASDEFNNVWDVLSKNFTKEQKANLNLDSFHEAAEAGKDFGEITTRSAKDIQAELEKVNDLLDAQKQELIRLEAIQKASPTGSLGKERNLYRTLTAKGPTESKTSIAELEKRRKALEAEQRAIEQLKKSYEKYSKVLGNLKLDGVITSASELRERFAELSQLTEAELIQILNDLQSSGLRAAEGLAPFSNAIDQVNESARQLSTTQEAVGEFTRRLEHIFSTAGAIRLATRSFRNAFQVVKDLDKEMTEIAVVTPMTLDQVWSRRSGYVKTARELGAATLDVVAASKLYYQQGLSEAEVNKITVETIKMARIAHLDGARATDLMTAALRGFNLEMSQASHVNDVYSQLAAKSAADTEEIANAMTKTASIAYSAGASFDNTAAFLTQMIETTREASENLGTAMKTIVARFQEMKKAPEEIGEVEGEIVDANKFETALRTIGIALRDVRTGEFRKFDDVIMEISEKWDSLDQLSQRYIATTAAGSRQQSRFIALVSNHARLMELTGLAATSAGASQEQFNKTLDSLEAKMNRLSTAKELFFTNILDSGAIKAFVGAGTGLLEFINKLTGSFGGLGSSISTALLSVGAFTLIPRVVKKALQSVGLVAISEGEKAGKEFIGGIIRGTKGESEKGRVSNIFRNLFGIEKQVQQTIPSLQELTKTHGNLTNVTRLLNKEQIANLGLIDGERLKTIQLEGVKLGQIDTLNKTAVAKQEQIILDQVQLGFTEAQTKAEIQNQVSKMGLVGATLTYIQASIAGKLATGAENEARLVEIGLLKTATKERIKATAAALGYKLAIVGVIAIIAGLIYAIERWIVTDKERLKDLQERIDKYKNSIEDTKNAIKDLQSAHEELNSLRDDLSELTQGTLEWKQALIEVNNKVLELISTYPELAAYVEKTDRGLNIKAEGYEKVLAQQYRSLAIEQQAQLFAQIESLELEFKIDSKSFNKLQKEIQREFGLNFEEIQQIASSFFREGGTVEGLEQASSHSIELLENLSKDITGTFEDFSSTIIENGDQFKTLGAASLKFAQELEGLNSSFFGIIDENHELLGDLLSNDVTKPIVKAIFEAGKTDSKFQAQVEAEKQEIVRQENIAKSLSVQEKQKQMKYAFDKGGYVSEVSIFDLEREYRKLHSLTVQELADLKQAKKVDKEKMRSELAQQRMMDKHLQETKERAEEFERLQKTDPLLGKGLLNLVNDNFAELTNAQLEAILESSDTTMAELLGLNEESLEKLKEEAIKAQDKINEIYRDGLTGSSELLYDGLTAGLGMKLKDKFSKIMANILATSGEEAADATLSLLAAAFKDLDTEKLSEALNYFAAIDPSNTQELKDFGEYLKELGVGLDSDQIDEAVAALGRFNKAIYKLSIKELEDKLLSIGKILKEISAGETAKFSEDRYKEIIEFDPSFATKFSKDLEGNFHYLGGTNEELISILERMTKIMEEDVRKTKTEEVQAGKIAKEQSYILTTSPNITIGAPSYNLDYKAAQKGSAYQQRQFLEKYIEDLYAQGGDRAGITRLLGFDPEGDLSELDKEAVEKAFDNIETYAQEYATNEADLARMELNTAVTRLESMDPLSILAESQDIFDTGDLQAYSWALMTLGESYPQLIKYVNELRDAQLAGNTEQIKATQTLLAQGLAYERTASKVGKYSNSIDALINHFREIEKLEPAEVFRELNFVFNDLLELSISEEFLQSAENYDLFLQVLEGSQEAWDTLIELINETDATARNLSDEIFEFGEEFGITGNVIKNVVAELDELEFTIEGDADITQLIAQLRNAGLATDEAIQLLEKLGNSRVIGIPKYEKTLHPGTGRIWDRFIGYDYKFIEGTSKSRISGGSIIGGGGGSGVRSSPFSSRARDDTTKGGGGGKEEAPWENSYDWLYNLVQKTNKEIRKRNILEWEYGKLLTDNKQSIADILKNIEKQEASLKQQQQYYKDQEEGRKIELEVIRKGYSDVSQYAGYDTVTGVVHIDWAAIEKITDKEKGERVAAYITELERIQSELESIEDAQRDTIDKLEELKKLGKSEYLSLENRVLAAVVAQRQDEIDTLQQINESINNGNSRLLARLQKGIDAQRRARQEEKTLESIGSKERRLSLLQQDVSGANALEILKLQEELEQERENYTDTLIDKAIQELQDGHDKASEQRDLQIQLMQNQLDFEEKQGLLWGQVHALMEKAVNADGSVNIESDLFKMLGEWENAGSLSAIGYEEWITDLNSEVQAGMAWYYNHTNPATSDDIDQVAKITSGLETPLVRAIQATEKYHPKPDPNTGAIKNNTATANQHLKKIADKKNVSNVKVDIEIPMTGGGGGTAYFSHAGNVTYSAYKDGGLADYTGPAWLDGTKAKPEAVLNPQDTKNFISLRNILRDLLADSKSTGKGSGDNYYQFDVKVDQLSNDYDVEQLVKKMKRMITEDAQYRNVNALSLQLR